MKANGARVMDLFREWDTDGDGEVSRKEFHKAMPLLGFDASKKDIDDLFTAWDKDGGASPWRCVSSPRPRFLAGSASRARRLGR